MKQTQKAWTFVPKKTPKPKVPENVKIEVEAKAKDLIESFLKPTNIKPPSEKNDSSYIVDIYSKWYHNYYNFYSKYHCRAANCIAPFFETKFARMEYAGSDRFNLSYMRYTEQWFENLRGLSMNECFARIKDDPTFLP